MSSVDNRVVEMEFDNAGFETGVSQTIQSLDRLRESLKLDNIDTNVSSIASAINGIDVSAANSAMDSIIDKFSVLGTIADQVLRNIGNAIFSVGRSLLNNIISPLTTGGWNRAMNIEKARFAIEGLGLSFEELSKDIMTSVNDTAYTFDAAANAASSLAASGIRPGHQMLVFLRAITGLAAQTNSEYSDMANIFTTIAGNGQVMTMQLRQLSLRGMNAAATLAKFFNRVNAEAAKGNYVQNRDFVNWVQSEIGTAQLTEADIYELVRKGKISASLFAAAMDETFGEHASKANDTFAGSLANIRAALSKIGQMFSAPIIQQMPDIFNAIRKSINDIKAAMTPFIDDASDYNAAIKEIIRTVAAWIDSRNLEWFEHVIRGTDKLVREIYSIGGALFSIAGAPVIQDFLARLFGEKVGEFDWIAAVFERVAAGYEDLITTLTADTDVFRDHLTHFATGFWAVLAGIGSAIDMSVAGTLNILVPILSTLSEIFAEIGSNVGDVVYYAFENLLDAGKRLSVWVREVTRFLGKTASAGLRGIFTRIQPSIDKIAQALTKVIDAFSRLTQTIHRHFWPIFNRLKTPISDIGKQFVDGLGSALGFVLDRVADVIDAFASLIDFLATNSQWLDLLTNIIGVSATAFGWLIDKVSEVIELFKQLQESTTDIELDFSIQGLGRSGYNLLTAFAQSFGISQEYVDIFAGHVNKAMEVVGGFATSVRDWFLGIDFAAIWESIKNFGKNVADTFINELVPAFQEGLYSGLQKVGEILSTFGIAVAGKVQSVFDTYIRPAFENLFGDIAEKIQSFWNGVITSINRVLKNKDMATPVGKEPIGPFKGIKYLLDEVLNFDFDAAIDIILGYISDIKTLAIDLAQGIGEITYKVGSVIRNFLFNVGWYDLVDFINGLLALWTRWNLARLIGNIAGVVGEAKNVLKQVAGFIKSASKVFKGISRVLNATALLEVAAAFLLIVIAFEKLGRLMEELQGSSSLSAAWTTMILLFAVLLASFWFINKLSADAVKPAEGALENVDVLGSLITEIKNGLGKVAEGFRMAGVASAVIALAAAVFLLVSAIVLLSMLPWQAVVIGAGVVIGVLASLGFLTKAIKDSGNALGMAAFGMLAIAIAIGIIVSSIVKIFNLLSEMTESGEAARFDRALGVVTGLLFVLLLMFAGLIAAAHFLKPSKEAVAAIAAAGIAIVLVTAALFLIAGAMHALKRVSPETIQAEADAFTRIIVIISVMILAIVAVSKLVGGGWGEIIAAGAAIALVMVTINILSLAIAGLSFVDPARLDGAVRSMTILVIVIAAALGVLTAVGGKDWGGLIAAAGSLLIMAAAMSVLVEALHKIEELGDAWSSLGVAIVALSVLTIFAVGLGAVAAGLGPAMLIGVAAIVILVYALDSLGDALNNIADALNAYQDIGASAENIGAVLSEIVQAFENWGSFGLAIAGFTGGITDAAAALVELSPVIEAFRNVGNAPDNIGKVVTGIVDGLKSTGVDNVFAGAQALASAADGLIALSPVLQTYSGDFGMIPSNIRAVCESIVNGVAGLTGKGEAGAVFKDVAQGLKTLASVLQSYARDNIEEIAENFKKVCKKIGEGMKSFGTPDQYAESFSKVASGLKTMAPALAAYKDISAEDAQHICTIIQNIGAAFVGMEEIDNEAVSTAASSFASISDSLQNFPTDVSSITSALGEVTGSLETFTGDTTDILSNFDLEALMESAGITSESLYAFLGQGAGEAGNIAGGEYVTAVQEQIAGGLNWNGSGGGAMVPGGANVWEGGEDKARSAGAAMGNAYVEGFESSGATDKVGEMIQSTGQALAEGVGNIDAAQYGRQVVTDYMQGFHGNASSIAAAIYTIGLSVANGFEKAKSAFENAGKAAATALVNGMSVAGFALESKGRSMANAVISGLQNGASPSRAREVGYNFVQGFVNGVQNNSFLAFVAGRIVGERAVSGLKWGTQSHSPSKAAMVVGGYFTEGFAIGINNNANDVEKSAFGLGTTADRALNEAIGTALSWFDDNNGDITITPVLDLSEIQAGSRTMQSMLGASTPMLAAGYGYSSAMLSGANNVASRGNAQSVTYQFDFGNAVLNNDADMQNAALNLLETLKRKADMYG